MISVAEAKTLIAQNIQTLPAVCVPLVQAANCTLAQDVVAQWDIPAFPQSSMDGYAFRFADKHLPLTIVGEMAAGTSQNFRIETGEAARVFTGAPVPAGADTVVMQEKTSHSNDRLSIQDAGLKCGSNVRDKGSEAVAGSVAMLQGVFLSPGAIGFIAALGEAHVFVYPMPSVSIIVTGNELQAPGRPLSAGQVYESNSFSLRAALQQAGIRAISIIQADDELPLLAKTLSDALRRSDVVLLTGGVSVGDYDFVLEATKLCGVQQLFHRVKQRPGKPLYFGRQHTRLVFGLPGNPSSVLSCFYQYVLPALETLSNKKHSLRQLKAALTQPVTKPQGLTHFLKGLHENGEVAPLGAQESYRLSSFAQANCLICLEEDRGDLLAGEKVEIYLLPGMH